MSPYFQYTTPLLRLFSLYPQPPPRKLRDDTPNVIIQMMFTVKDASGGITVLNGSLFEERI